MTTWMLGQFFRFKASEGDLTTSVNHDYLRKSYKFNTIFKNWYGLRFLLYMVGGIVFLILLTTKQNVSDFLCNRYYDLSRQELLEIDTDDEKANQASIEYCEKGVKIFLWTMYFPLLVFQLYSFRTLENYGNHVLNKEMSSMLLAEEPEVEGGEK